MENGEVKKLSERIQAWADSEQGQAALKTAFQDAQKTTKDLEKARQVDPHDLHRHFTL